jgi:hypothetical protein
VLRACIHHCSVGEGRYLLIYFLINSFSKMTELTDQNFSTRQRARVKVSQAHHEPWVVRNGSRSLGPVSPQAAPGKTSQNCWLMVDLLSWFSLVELIFGWFFIYFQNFRILVSQVKIVLIFYFIDFNFIKVEYTLIYLHFHYFSEEAESSPTRNGKKPWISMLWNRWSHLQTGDKTQPRLIVY